MGSSGCKISSLVCSLWIISTAALSFPSDHIKSREIYTRNISHSSHNYHPNVNDHGHHHHDEDSQHEHFQNQEKSGHSGNEHHQEHHEHPNDEDNHNHHYHHEQDKHYQDQDHTNRIFDIPLPIWLAGLGSTVVVSLVGLLAVGAVPLLQGPHQDTLLQFLVSLAVGTLVGDALIHLLPHALQTGHDDAGAAWKGFIATMTIIAFFLLDKILEGAGHSHCHPHIGPGSDQETLATTHSPQDLKQLPKSSTGLFSFHHNYQRIEKQSLMSLPNSSLMVIVGDAMHNFADGLAIGAAFSVSMAAGLSTSLAVLCHELPHEVGDFALLFHSGMSVKVAIFYNCVSSIFAVIGLVAGLLLGVHASFSTWLLSSTVGVFLYVALVSMMTELQGRGVGKAVLNTVGMTCGAVLLLFIGLYEHDLLSLFTEHPHH